MEAKASFTALPRELRDHIFHFVALDEHSFRIKRAIFDKKPQKHRTRVKHPFVTNSSLVLVSRQVRKEYLAALRQTALAPNLDTRIIVSVTNLRFRAAINFVRCLSGRAIRNISCGPKAPKLHIQLAITNPADITKKLAAGVEKWQFCCTKLGVTAEYEVDDSRCGKGISSTFEITEYVDAAADGSEAKKVWEELRVWQDIRVDRRVRDSINELKRWLQNKQTIGRKHGD